MKQAIKDLFRLLSFRLGRDDFDRFGRSHLILGLLCTWVVGMGRWWDDPGANLLQHIGLGSLIYVFVLALVLCLVIAPLNPRELSYRHVLTFVALTSPPAILYAIPVEKFTSLSVAREINIWFLAAVASWRVALLFFYLKRYAGLPIYAILVAGLLPLSGIVTTLTVLNLERAVFDIMGGLRETGTANDSAYAVLATLTFFSALLFVPLLIAYVIVIVVRSKRFLDED